MSRRGAALGRWRKGELKYAWRWPRMVIGAPHRRAPQAMRARMRARTCVRLKRIYGSSASPRQHPLTVLGNVALSYLPYLHARTLL